jgi:branched-chain amino acid transport system ATP-binding protein
MTMGELHLEGVTGGYIRGVDVVRGVTMRVQDGSVVSLLGANGAGKTTLLRLTAGTLPLRSGVVSFGSERLDRLPCPGRVRRGIVLVPQGHQLFMNLTVRENLLVGGWRDAAAKTRMADVFELFPALARLPSRQRAGSLSGGQRAMVAVARALMARPSALLLDEPSQGLAPSLRRQLFADLRRLACEQNIAVLVAEQDVVNVVPTSDYVVLLRRGEIYSHGPPADVSDTVIREAYFS